MGPGAFAGRPVPAPEVAAPPVVLRRYLGDEAPQLLEAVLVSRERLRPWLAFASAEPLDEEIARFVEANRASAAVARRLGFLLAEVVDEEPQAPGESGHCMVWVMGRDAWSSGGPSRG